MIQEFTVNTAHFPLRVTILSSESPENACARVRLADVLKQQASAVSFTWNGIPRCQGIPHKVEQEIRDADVVVVQRAFPRFETMELMQWILFESGKPVVYEIDDLLTELPEQHPDYSTYQRYRHLMESFIANCDALITSTPVLRNFYAPLNQRGYVYPNTLNESMWYGPYPNRGARSAECPVTIGFVGTSTHAKDLVCVEEALECIYAKFGERVRFMFFGCITDRLERLPGLIHQTGFVPYSEYPALLKSLKLDIGLAPLEESPFNACKSNIKYLEYAACGIPGVYSDLPPYRDSVHQGVTGLLVENTSQSWFDAITTLVEDAEIADQIASTAFEDVWDRFSMHKRAQHWLELMETIVSQHQCKVQPGDGIARAMWEQAVVYEQYLTESKSQLNRAIDQIRWLESRPLLRIYRVLKNGLRMARG